MSKPRPKSPRRASTMPPPSGEVVDPRWIIKALVITLLAAVFCAYLALCLLFYQGQWQLVLHPSPKVDATPASLGLAFEPVNFAVDETAKPQLTGWNIPASTPGVNALLYLHDGDSTMSAALPRLKQLHDLGFNIFIFDYRGYGNSAAIHPNQLRMTEDAEHALTWLRTHSPGQSIIPYGVGVGASLATALAASHPEIPALILENPKADLLPEVAKDPRTKSLPLSLLFHDRFPLAQTLQTLRIPKLLLTDDSTALPVYRAAPDPKRISEFPSTNTAAYVEAVGRFSEEYLNRPTTSLPAKTTQ